MALAGNTRFQLAERLQADIQLREPTYTVVSSTQVTAVPGDPLLTVKNASAATIAIIAIDRRTFSGFNVVAELSSSAAEGLPEHIGYMLIDTAQSQTVVSKMVAYLVKIGFSSVQIGFVAAGSLTEANLTAANVAFELSNDARYGASGQ